MQALLAALLLAFVLALVIVRVLASERLAALVLDVPNDRSLHDRPIPRTGGVGLILGATVAMLACGSAPAAIILPTVLLAAFFLIEDVRGLPVPVRFLAQFIAAVAYLAGSGGSLPLPALLLPLLAFGLVWCANLYNFMDGSNGLAGGMALIGFGAYAIAAHQAGADDLALVAVAVSGAAAGFLVWNFDPARIFLGDAGSIPIGFLAAAVGVEGWLRGTWAMWFPLLVFSPFVLDSTVTLLRRIVRGERFWEAHRSHYYQRLIRSGWSHRQLAVAAYLLMLAAAGAAVGHRADAAPMVVLHLAIWTAAYVLGGVAIDRHWATYVERASTGNA